MTHRSVPKRMCRRSEAFRSAPKFVGLTAGLILLLSLTAFISLRNSAETVRQIGSVVDFAIPPMALSRAATSARWSRLWNCDDRSCSRRTRPCRTMRSPSMCRPFQGADRISPGGHRCGTTARRASGTARRPRAWPPICRRLTDGAHRAQALTEIYEKEAAACLAAISARSLPEARQRLVTIDGLRQELGERLEAIRAGMFATLKVISKEAKAAQARALVRRLSSSYCPRFSGSASRAIGAMRVIRSIKSVVRARRRSKAAISTRESK